MQLKLGLVCLKNLILSFMHFNLQYLCSFDIVFRQGLANFYSKLLQASRPQKLKWRCIDFFEFDSCKT